MAPSNNPDDGPTDAELLAGLTGGDEFTTENNHGETQRWRVTETKENESSVSGSIDYRVLCDPIDGNDYSASFAEFRADPNVNNRIQNTGSLATDYGIVEVER